MDLLTELAASYDRVCDTVSAMAEDELREPSALPGWNRADVVTHLARSADAYRRLLAIARGQNPPAPREDLRTGFSALFADARAMPAAAWDAPVTARGGWSHPARFTLQRCRRELETHHVDLAAGYRTADWPTGYVEWALDDTLAALAARRFGPVTVHAVDLDRRWDLGTDGPSAAGPGHALLAWLSGRADGRELGAELPVPPAWPLPPVRFRP
ncbi:maleylpyruvate isomerase family mycothiol-dependent enzyme [Kitasatospora terrestris]|uniref:Maleylpyruvate isomerase family mycothiol-dependent enzyme n=1 Tax=Kitasatospora terrestris TaxID=258051 RepID=A0ABP9DK26_9ACTN